MFFRSFFPRIGVFTRFQFDSQRRALELQLADKEVAQVTPVDVREMLGTVPVNHDNRRISPTLVRVTQLDAPTVMQGRIVLEHGFFEQIGQIAGIELAKRRCIGLVHRGHQFANAGTVFGRYEMLRREGDEGQAPLQGAAVMLTLLGIEAVTLVDRDDQRATTVDHVAKQGQVLVGQSITGIDDDDGDMCFLDGLERLDDTELLDRLLYLATPPNAGGIDQGIGLRVDRRRLRVPPRPAC